MNTLSPVTSLPRASTRWNRGFTLFELLVLLALIAVLAAMLLPALAKSKTKAMGIMCLNNNKQLLLAWIMYADDSQNLMVGNYHGAVTQGPNPTTNNWVAGWLDWGLRPDNTNQLFLSDARWSRLAPYLGKNPAVFKCPTDNFVSPAQTRAGWKQRVRSASMNACMGAGDDKQVEGGRIYLKITDLQRPGPAMTWVLIDEHPDSINDGCFFVNLVSPAWIDVPAASHNDACGFGFADGHAEIKKWRELGSWANPVRFAPANTSQLKAATDYEWLKDRTCELK